MNLPPFINKVLSEYFRWLAGGLMVVVLILGYNFLIAPKVDTIKTTGILERQQAQADLASEKKHLSELQSSITKFHSVLPIERIQQIDDLIPATADFPGLLLTLKNLAVTANLSLEGMSVGQVAAHSPQTSQDSSLTVGGLAIRVQDVSVSVSGGTSYEAFKNYLMLIESSRRLLDIISVNFSNAAPADHPEAGSPYSLVVRTYYLPPSQK